MSKKSKKILAYLMFFAALCGTPAVSEARGGSGDQVKTAQASAAQRGNSSSSLISGLLSNYGFEAVKWMLLGGGGFGFAKMSKVGDLNALARYLLNLKDAKSKDAEKLMKQLDDQRKALDKDKKDFDVQRAKALNDHTNLNNEKVALELSNKSLAAKVKESAKKIEELENNNQNLNKELVNAKNYSTQLFDITEEDKRKLNLLLSSVIDSKMSGEFVGSYNKEEGYWKSYGVDKLILEPFSIENVVRVALVKYDVNNGNVVEVEKIELGTDDFLNNVKSKAKDELGQDATDEVIALSNFGLVDFGVPGLARYSFYVMKDNKVEKLVAAYFPVKYAEDIDENNNEQNVNNNVVNNENNENVNNEDNNQ